MGLLASTFDVESVVFLRRGSHFLAFYGAGGRPWDGLVGVNFRCRKFGIPYAKLALSGFQWATLAFRRRVPRPPLPNERINHGLSGAADRGDVEPL